MDEIHTNEFSSMLFTVTSTALTWDFYFFKLTQPLTVSRIQLLYTVKEKRGKPDRKPLPLPYSLRNPYRNLKSGNSQDYAQKSQQNFLFINSTSGLLCPGKIVFIVYMQHPHPNSPLPSLLLNDRTIYNANFGVFSLCFSLSLFRRLWWSSFITKDDPSFSVLSTASLTGIICQSQNFTTCNDVESFRHLVEIIFFSSFSRNFLMKFFWLLKKSLRLPCLIWIFSFFRNRLTQIFFLARNFCENVKMNLSENVRIIICVLTTLLSWILNIGGQCYSFYLFLSHILVLRRVHQYFVWGLHGGFAVWTWRGLEACLF